MKEKKRDEGKKERIFFEFVFCAKGVPLTPSGYIRGLSGTPEKIRGLSGTPLG